MEKKLDLVLEQLETIDAPLTDREWGILAGAGFVGGVLIGIAIAT